MSDHYGVFDENPSLDFDRDLYESWLKELRNPESTQTRGRLKDEHGRCCLGVLVDVAGGGDWLPYVVRGDDGEALLVREDYVYPQQANVGLEHDWENTSGIKWKPKKQVCVKSIQIPAFLVQRATGGTLVGHQCTSMNDLQGKSFAEIADAIEAAVRTAGYLEESE